MPRTPIVTLLLTAVLTLAAACGTRSGFAADQPTHRRALEAGELAALPTPGGAVPFGVGSKTDTSVTQSFKVTGLAPTDVIQWYSSSLRAGGWTISTPPAQGGDVWRGQWARNDRLLQVTAEPNVDDGTNGAPASQFDLILRAAP